MPRKAIDYSKTIIYKLVCNDTNVTDLYVGHTTSFVDRKKHHKSCCTNPKDKSHNYKVYQMIRENGGWMNWTMVMIEPYPCENVLEASKKEREWLEILKASLNSQVPCRTDKEYSEQYYQANHETILEQCKSYREKNRAIINEKNKVYRLKNRIKINERRRENRKKLKIQNQAESILPT